MAARTRHGRYDLLGTEQDSRLLLFKLISILLRYDCPRLSLEELTIRILAQSFDILVIPSSTLSVQQVSSNHWRLVSEYGSRRARSLALYDAWKAVCFWH